MKTKYKKPLLVRFLVAFLAIMLLFSSMQTSTSMIISASELPADKPDKKTEDEKEGGNAQKEADISFYKVASAASTYYEELHNPKSKKYDAGGGTLRGISMNNAASLMGFKDEDYDSWIIGATISKLSSSSQGRGYTAPEVGVQAYLLYGNALSSLGLDVSTNANNLSIASLGRKIFGSLFYAFYVLALGADTLLKGCLKLLYMLNPFSLYTGDGGINSGKIGAIDGVGKPMWGLQGLSNVLSKFYHDCQEFAWLIIPFMLVYVLWGYVMHAKNQEANRSKLRKYVTRVFFIGLGVPVLAASLVFSLQLFNSIKDGAGYSPNGIVAMTFMDFETWVKQNRLGLPSRTVIKVDTSLSSGGAIAAGTSNPTDIAATLNTHIAPRPHHYPGRDDSTGEITNAEILNNESMTSKWKGAGTETLNAFDLLDRFRSGAFYEAAAFESDVKNGSTINFGEKENDISKRANWHKNGPSWLSGGKDLISDSDPNMLRGSGSGNIWRFTGVASTFSGVGESRSRINDIGALSTLGMYNYLNTTFSPSTVTVYSANKASSIIIRDAHRSVTLVGEGIMKYMNYLNGLILLMFISTVAIGYGLGMLMNNLKRTIRLIIAVPLSVLGSLKMMARLTAIVFMMIVEIMGTLLSYIVVLQLVYGINKVITETFRGLFARISGFSGAIGLPSVNGLVGGLLITLIVLIIVNIWFLLIALKIRSAMLKVINEWVMSITDRIFMVQDQNGNGPAMQAMQSDKSLNPRANQNSNGLLNTAKQLGKGMLAGQGLARGLNLAKNALGKNGVSMPGVIAGVMGSRMEGADRQAEGSKMADNEKRLNQSAASTGKELLESGITSLGNIGKKNETPNTISGFRENDNADKSQEAQAVIKQKRMKALKSVAIGAGEIAAGYATGNVAFIRQGAKNLGTAAQTAYVANKDEKKLRMYGQDMVAENNMASSGQSKQNNGLHVQTQAQTQTTTKQNNDLHVQTNTNNVESQKRSDQVTQSVPNFVSSMQTQNVNAIETKQTATKAETVTSKTDMSSHIIADSVAKTTMSAAGVRPVNIASLGSNMSSTMATQTVNQLQNSLGSNMSSTVTAQTINQAQNGLRSNMGPTITTQTVNQTQSAPMQETGSAAFNTNVNANTNAYANNRQGNTISMPSVVQAINHNQQVSNVESYRTNNVQKNSDVNTVRSSMNQGLGNINTMKLPINQGLGNINAVRSPMNQSFGNVNMINASQGSHVIGLKNISNNSTSTSAGVGRFNSQPRMESALAQANTMRNSGIRQTMPVIPSMMKQSQNMQINRGNVQKTSGLVKTMPQGQNVGSASVLGHTVSLPILSNRIQKQPDIKMSNQVFRNTRSQAYTQANMRESQRQVAHQIAKLQYGTNKAMSVAKGALNTTLEHQGGKTEIIHEDAGKLGNVGIANRHESGGVFRQKRDKDE